jgi:hypothetical protein
MLRPVEDNFLLAQHFVTGHCKSLKDCLQRSLSKAHINCHLSLSKDRVTLNELPLAFLRKLSHVSKCSQDFFHMIDIFVHDS